MGSQHITVRELVEGLLSLNQETLIVMALPSADCAHAFCETVKPTVQRRTSKIHPGQERYMLAPARRTGNDYGPLILEDEEE